MIEGPITKLLDCGKTIRLTIDGDMKLKKALQGIQNLIVCFDLAHALKNVQKNLRAVLGDADFFGDSLKKIGFTNFLSLCNSIKTAMIECVKQVNEQKWSEATVRGCLQIVVDHYAGNHQLCKGVCSMSDLKTFFGSKNGQKAEKGVRSYLQDDEFVSKLLSSGSTRHLEAFHGFAVHKGFVGKRKI